MNTEIDANKTSSNLEKGLSILKENMHMEGTTKYSFKKYNTWNRNDLINFTICLDHIDRKTWQLYLSLALEKSDREIVFNKKKYNSLKTNFQSANQLNQYELSDIIVELYEVADEVIEVYNNAKNEIQSIYDEEDKRKTHYNNYCEKNAKFNGKALSFDDFQRKNYHNLLVEDFFPRLDELEKEYT